jgi:hypothetical protein
MKLKIDFELPISNDYHEYFILIAKLFGWNESLEISASEFVCKHICEPQVKSLIGTLIKNSTSSYFGMSQIDKIEDLMQSYNNSVKVIATIVD